MPEVRFELATGASVVLMVATLDETAPRVLFEVQGQRRWFVPTGRLDTAGRRVLAEQRGAASLAPESQRDPRG